MELPSKLLEQIAFNTRPKIEEHMLVVLHKNTHEEHLSQPLQTKNEQLKKAIFFLTGCNGIFNVTKKNTVFFKKSISDRDNFFEITIPPGAYEIESLNNEIRRIIIDEGHFTEVDYTFTIKPNFTTLGFIIEISPQGPIISFIFNATIKNILGFRETIFIKNIIYHIILLLFCHLMKFFQNVILLKV